MKRTITILAFAAALSALAGAASAQGFAIALRAARMALARVFRRFFLPYQPPVLTRP